MVDQFAIEMRLIDENNKQKVMDIIDTITDTDFLTPDILNEAKIAALQILALGEKDIYTYIMGQYEL